MDECLTVTTPVTATAQLLADYAMVQSMSRKGNCWDNAPMESFYKTLKVKRVYQLDYETRAQARLDIVNWIEGGSTERLCLLLQSGKDYLTNR